MASESSIKIRPITQEEFRRWRAESVIGYAEDKVAAGNWAKEESLERSENAFRQLLPDGLQTKDHLLYSLWHEDSARSAGIIWFHMVPDPRKVAYIYDFVIYPEFRGKGLGRASLLAAEAEVKALGAKSVELHVFAHNKTARQLYETSGYTVTNLNMSKQL